MSNRRSHQLACSVLRVIPVLSSLILIRVAGAALDVPKLEFPATHWAYQAPHKRPVPEVTDTTWPRNDIDCFILARLEAKQLRPAAPADPATLVRRLYYDLIGLPPTPEQIDEFIADSAPEAIARLVGRLLASPQFGERWGRHWLDVVRYGESLTLRGFVFPEAWRYRDYVIDSFNRDNPYHRFIQEQIAGDLLPAASLAEQRRHSIATTFLVLGNINLEEQDKKQLDMDVVDEQLDTIGKTFLAQTIGCARCHDHKFDPIPTRDYYALAGILRGVQTLEHANVSKWLEMSLPLEADQEKIFAKHEAALRTLQTQLKEAKDRLAKAGPSVTGANGSGKGQPIAVTELTGVVVDDTQAKRVGEWTHSQYSKNYVGDGYLHDGNADKGAKTLTFHPETLRAGVYEVRLAYVPSSNRSPRVPVNILHADGESVVYVNQQETPRLDGHFASLGQFRFEANGQGYVMISNEGTQGHVIADAVQFIPLDDISRIVAAKFPSNPTEVNNTADSARRAADADVKQLESRIKELTEHGPKRPVFMGVKETGRAGNIRVHKRGSVHTLGDSVPRGFLEVTTRGQAPVIPENQSGRLQLSEWLISPENPLTARVFVNRVWHWLFGAGLVRTTDNFGTTGELPSHPELLDHLAVRFMEGGWSTKKLIHEIVLSRTYQLSSLTTEIMEVNRAEEKIGQTLVTGLLPPQPPSGHLLRRGGEVRNEGAHSPKSLGQYALTSAATRNHEIDPDNRLLWRMNRRPLEAEALRDTILFVSGQLEWIGGSSTIKGGVSADYGYQHTEKFRSVYVPIFRNALPDVFEAFDFADPSMVTGRRNASTVAPQALFFLNHPFVMENARHTAKRVLDRTDLNDAVRLNRICRMILGRPPLSGELALAEGFLQARSSDADRESDRLEAWSQMCQALFASADFRYLK